MTADCYGKDCYYESVAVNLELAKKYPAVTEYLYTRWKPRFHTELDNAAIAEMYMHIPEGILELLEESFLSCEFQIRFPVMKTVTLEWDGILQKFVEEV